MKHVHNQKPGMTDQENSDFEKPEQETPYRETVKQEYLNKDIHKAKKVQTKTLPYFPKRFKLNHSMKLGSRTRLS